MEAYGKTHIGKVRSSNEDSLFYSLETIGNYDNVFVIADGMGGHSAGEIASKQAVEAFVSHVENQTILTKEQCLIEAVTYANKSIYDLSIENILYQGMGTTLVGCSIDEEDDGMIYIVNVGDSRLYILSDTFDQITVDHSYVENLVRSGDITREESLTHPERNIITRALGTSEVVKVDLFKLSKKDVKKVFLCSDGLTNMVPDKKIESIINESDSAEDAVNRLVQYALEAGGIDNITCVLIDVQKSNNKEVPIC